MEAERTPDASREFALRRDDGQQTAVTGIKREAISPELVSKTFNQTLCFQRGVSSWLKLALCIVEKVENNFLVCTKY